jgi:hypothetical protein
MKTKVRNTSIQAFRSIDNLSHRQEDVLSALGGLGTACNLEVASSLHLPINSITPRMNELVKMGEVIESHRAVNPITHKRVIYWMIKQTQEKLLF